MGFNATYINQNNVLTATTIGVP